MTNHRSLDRRLPNINELKFKKVDPYATLPKRAHPTSGGLDLTCVDFSIGGTKDNPYIEYDTGIACEIPTGYSGFLFPKQDVAERGLYLANSMEYVESNYNKAIKIKYYFTNKDNTYTIGDVVCRLILIKTEIFDIFIDNKI